MKKILFAFAFISSLSLFSQDKSPVIHLNHNSFGIDTEYMVTIKPDSKSDMVYLKVFREKKSELDYSNPIIREITIEDYNKVLESIYEISIQDLIIDTGLMSESATFRIGVGDADNGFTYHIKGVHSGLIGTKFEDFFKSTKLILELAEIKQIGITK